MLVIAMGDVNVEIIHIIVEVFLGIGLAYVATKSQKIDALEKKLDKKADELINAKFDSYTSSLRYSMNQVTTQIEAFNRRLDEGDGDLRQLVERDREEAIGLERRFGEMRTWMTDKFVTSDELDRHQESVKSDFRTVETQLGELMRQMAVTNSILNRRQQR